MAAWQSRPQLESKLRGTRTTRGLLALAAWFSSVAAARACPDCNIGRVARAQFWHDQFAWNLTVALSPFLVMVAICLLVERIGSHPRSGE